MLDFVIVGAEKCGTSWVDTLIRNACERALPKTTKELFYYDRHYHLGSNWHAKQFDSKAQIKGEVSPSYFSSELASQRLSEASPDCKIVAILREPYTRMASHILHRARKGSWDIKSGLDSIPNKVLIEARSSSQYKAHLERWSKSFNKQNLLVLSYHDIQSDPIEFSNKLFSHIGVDGEIEDAVIENISKKKVYEAAQSKWPLVSRALYKVSTHAQSMGMANVIEKIKSTGIKKLIETSEYDGQIRNNLIAHLRKIENFDPDIHYVSKNHGFDFDMVRSNYE